MIGQKEERLLEALKQSLNPELEAQRKSEEAAAYYDMFDIARKHAVLSLLSDVYEEDEGLPAGLRQELRQAAATVVRSNYRLLLLHRKSFSL